jgi:glycosyltransferase involved in cell wall biosynthesis
MYTFDSTSAPEHSFTGTLRELNVPSKRKGKFAKVQTMSKRMRVLKSQIKQDKIDLLISFCSTANFPAMFMPVPKVASIRVYTEYENYKNIYRFMIKHTSERLIVQTRRLQKDIIADVGEKYASKIIVIGNPLDTCAIKVKKAEKLDAKTMQLIEGKKVITFVSSFKSTKNHWNLLKSFKLLHEKNKDTVLLLIGTDGELETKIRDMAESDDISDAVVFVGKTDNPFRYLNKTDVFVLPSITEGIPNVLIEALAVGVPVIASDCPSGPRELLYERPDLEKHTKGIEYADYGVLVEEFDPKPDFDINMITDKNKNLTKAMEQMLFDDRIAERYRQAANKKSGAFNLNEYSKKLESIINYCLKK